MLKRPSRSERKIFVVPYHGYIYVAPFVVDAGNNLALKTVFPSRKYHKTYGGKQ